MKYHVLWYDRINKHRWVPNWPTPFEINEAFRMLQEAYHSYPHYYFRVVEEGTDLATLPKPEGVS